MSERDKEGARNLLFLAASPRRRAVEILLQADGRFKVVKCWLRYPRGIRPFMEANTLLVKVESRPDVIASVDVRSKRPGSNKVFLHTFHVKGVHWSLASAAKKSYSGLVDDLAHLRAEIVVKDREPVLVLSNLSCADRSKCYVIQFKMQAFLK